MKFKRIFFIFLYIFLIICFFSNNTYASEFGGIESTMRGVTDSGETIGAINDVIGLIQVAGTGISVIVVSLLGIKYIIASIEERAEIKKQAVPIVIGCILLFGATNILKVVASFANKLND